MENMSELTIIGAGLAGCEAAWQAASQGMHVRLYEMRPENTTSAHSTPDIAELVCSNSLGSNLPDRAAGLLKNELRRLNSLLMSCADKSSLPAGDALAVDRTLFSQLVSESIAGQKNITLLRQEIHNIPSGPVIIASGPLTSPDLAKSIQSISGQENLSFFDAIAPIVSLDSIDMTVAFRASRGSGEEGDYINCPFTSDEYLQFVQELVSAQQIPIHNSEDPGLRTFFESCLPIEEIARRSPRALTFGPMRPTGLFDPHSQKRPYAIVQLRQDNLANTLYNLVGFQTNLKYPEQERIFRMIPGLAKADFVRFGQMHRNTFIASPALLKPSLQFINHEDLFFAGQITGVEGYVGSIATGLLAGINAARVHNRQVPLALPHHTMLGALVHYITHAEINHFQPMKANFGVLPPLSENIRSKRERYGSYVKRAHSSLEDFLIRNLLTPGTE
jgi:methylenetetrahydrofolate--tRNA-(uracil-5-)-methyltransferase